MHFVFPTWLKTQNKMTAKVHGWCRYVEKANDVVFQQMVLNKLWIPDVLIDIIKDYLYVGAEVVLNNYFKQGICKCIRGMNYENYTLFTDTLGRERVAVWDLRGPNGETSYLNISGQYCLTCGESSDCHQNQSCCILPDDDGFPDPDFALTEEFPGEDESDRLQ